jgi:hypothetical protein
VTGLASLILVLRKTKVEFRDKLGRWVGGETRRDESTCDHPGACYCRRPVSAQLTHCMSSHCWLGFLAYCCAGPAKWRSR